MKQHKKPCAECPFRRAAPAGWLGGFTPDEFRQMSEMEALMPCHRAAHAMGVPCEYGSASPEIPQCAGRAIHWANQYKTSRGIIPEMLELPRDPVAVFEWPHEFLKHHKSGPLAERREK